MKQTMHVVMNIPIVVPVLILHRLQMPKMLMIKIRRIPILHATDVQVHYGLEQKKNTVKIAI